MTEILHFFVAEYTPAQRASAGGGVEEEDIEVIELGIEEEQAMIASGEIRDGKTIMLLQYAALHLFGGQPAVAGSSTQTAKVKTCIGPAR